MRPDPLDGGGEVKTSEILDKAADVIATRGWWRGGYKEPRRDPRTCPVCVLGAINVATGSSPDAESSFKVPCVASAAANALAEYLYLNPGDDLIDVLGNEWNDCDVESAEEVVRKLRAAAASEREAGR
jgi:hypothetical protein